MADVVQVEPVSAPEFLLTGKLTGNFVKFACWARFCPLTREQIQRLATKLPTQQNREFLRKNREFEPANAQSDLQRNCCRDRETWCLWWPLLSIRRNSPHQYRSELSIGEITWSPAHFGFDGSDGSLNPARRAFAAPPFIGIFFAVKRRNMRWILVEIRACDPKLFFVRVGPLPQDFTRRASLRTCLALHAHGIGRKPMAIATAAAPAMV